ncbi:unnamed protein product [Clonostachys byssicola]|uniref:Uncharacterized protein n=1 Tax=Clonostachys byssicola TaxID=160290 RepID=A0A9N9UJT6_9HYPO|nr:unnamed protein product [Clonostachys byssicola]
MEAKPTYHFPPNFSTPPPPHGPFHLGTVLRDFENKEQMQPLNQGEIQRVAIPSTEKYTDHKGGFTATRKNLVRGERGLWAKFMALQGVGGEASLSTEQNDSDIYEFGSVETEFFYPTAKYISDCLNLSDVEDYLNGSRYKKPVYLVTGVKFAEGVAVRLEKKMNVQGKLELGAHIPGGLGIHIGPKAEGKLEDEPLYVFTESSDIVVGIQCLKIYHEKSGWLFGKQKVKSEFLTSGAAFYGTNSEALEEKLTNFIAGDPEGYNNPHLDEYVDGNEIWMLPKEFKTQMSQETFLSR